MAARTTGNTWRGTLAPFVGAALACLLAASGLAAQEPRDLRRAAFRKSVRRGPTVASEIPNYMVKKRLRTSFHNALRRVHWLESCRDLFARLGADGIEVLGNTAYALAREDWERQVCVDSNAFTTVGGSKVWLCGGFGWLSEADAAKVLLHEALHSAGLGEQPRDPNGLTPDEIDRMVEKRCGF